MKPDRTIGVTDRYRLKELTLERSHAIPSGRIMWCRGRRILGYGSVNDIARVILIPKGADTLSVSAADFIDIQGWLG